MDVVCLEILERAFDLFKTNRLICDCWVQFVFLQELIEVQNQKYELKFHVSPYSVKYIPFD